MKTLSLFIMLIFITNSAAAALKNSAETELQACQSLMKTANQVCKKDVGCKINYLEVSGADFVRTSSSVICRGEKNLIHGVKNSPKSEKPKAPKVKKELEKEFEF